MTGDDDRVCGCGDEIFRPELLDQIADGDAKLIDLMSGDIAHFARGQRLATAGQPHDFVWLLCDGWCIRSRLGPDGHRQILYVYTPTDLVAIDSLLLRAHTDTFQFLTNASLRKIDRKILHQAAAADYNIALRVMLQFLEEERRVSRRLLNIGQSSSENRVVTMLMNLEFRLSRLGMVHENSFRMPLKCNDIGDYIGASAAHVSRILQRLRQQRLADVGWGEVRLLDRERLTSIACGAKGKAADSERKRCWQ